MPACLMQPIKIRILPIPNITIMPVATFTKKDVEEDIFQIYLLWRPCQCQIKLSSIIANLESYESKYTEVNQKVQNCDLFSTFGKVKVFCIE